MSLPSQIAAPLFVDGALVTAVTLAAGDLRVRIDGGAWSDRAELPAVVEGVATLTLTTEELAAEDRVEFRFHDLDGAEFDDTHITAYSQLVAPMPANATLSISGGKIDGGNLVLAKGADYLEEHTTEIRFHVNNPPDLTDATAELVADQSIPDGDYRLILNGTLETISGTQVDAKFNILQAALADAPAATYKFRLNLRFNDGHVWTPLIHVNGQTIAHLELIGIGVD